MPIEYSAGSIFDSGAALRVCPVNCVGVMGKGLAKEFKVYATMPGHTTSMLEIIYKRLCSDRRMFPGSVFVVKSAEMDYYPPMDIALVATKDHWKNPSKIEWVDSVISALVKCKCKSIAIPALGCGLGGLPWADVKALIEKHFNDWPGRVIVFPPKEEG